MRGEVLFEKMTGISDEYIAEAALAAPVGVVAPKKKGFASLSPAWRRGLSAACICLIAIAALLMGAAAVGRFTNPAPEGTPPLARFGFTYELEDSDGTAMPGDTVYVDTTIVNRGLPFVYHGSSAGYHPDAYLVLQGNDSVTIHGGFMETCDVGTFPVAMGATGSGFAEFTIPKDATPGVYDLVLSYKGTTQVYPGVLTVGESEPPVDTTDRYGYSFGYELAGDAATGAYYFMDTWVINEGATFTFEGSSMGFVPTAALIHMETQYRIEGTFDTTTDFVTVTVNTGDKGQVIQEFFIPADAPTGAYALQLSYDGVTKSFPGAVIVAVPTDTDLEYPLLEDGHPFSFGYEPFGGFAIPGDMLTVEAWVVNEGDPFSFVGDPYSFQPTATLYHIGSDYTIGGISAPTGVEPRPCNVLTGQKGVSDYTFPIPTDAPTGEYGLRLSYGGAQETFDNVLTVAVPIDEEPAVLYNLTMSIGSDWLYEPLDEAYVDGELVTVRIRFATDVGTLFALNGERITTEIGDDQLGYWEYSFIMPAEDSQIMFKTYDGTAPYTEMLEALIQSDSYYFFNEEQFYYYGEFGNGAMAALNLGFDEAIGQTTVGGYTFLTPCTHDMLVFYNDTLYELSEAYEQGILTDEHLETMMAKHKEWFPYD